MRAGGKRQRVVLAGVETLMRITAPPPENEETVSVGRQSSLGLYESSSGAPSPTCHPWREAATVVRDGRPACASKMDMACKDVLVDVEEKDGDGNYLYDVMPAGACLGAEVMDQLRRSDEAMAEECLFLAQAYARRPCAATLSAVMGGMRRHGWRQAMAAMQHAALQETFLRCLCDRGVFAGESNLQRHVLSFVALLFTEAHHEALLRSYVVHFLVDALGTSQPARGGASSPSPPAPPPMTATHWSLQRLGKRTRCGATAVLAMATEEARGMAGVDAQLSAMGCDVQPARSGDGLVFDMFVQLMLARNQYSEATVGMPNVALLFVRLGGLSTLLGHEYDNTNERRTALTLLELLTASAALAEESEALQLIARWLLLHGLACGTSQDHAVCGTLDQDNEGQEDANGGEAHWCLASLRVLTNVTNLRPDALHGDVKVGCACGVVQLAHRLRVVLRQAWSRDDAELDTYVLCSAINVVKWEVREHLDYFATAFMTAGEDDGVVACGATMYDALAEHMLTAHARDETDRLVLSGYYALLLAVLSLVETAERSLRIPVISAIAKASCNSDIGRQVAHQPMKIVVAIVQEFLLFQSQTGTLTRQHVVETQTIIDEVVAANRINVSSE